MMIENSSHPVITVKSVSKRFRIYEEPYSSLKERFLHRGKRHFHDYWALKDVDFSVYKGMCLGILGANGSGKSTLLKLLAGVLKPTTGKIVKYGKVAGLLELGAGFHPEYTGRENIFVNGSILGMTGKEIKEHLDEIIEFSEVGEFIDVPVRNYSSGMYLRLAFAIATSLVPDIMLVDEVLSVGDIGFQSKCLSKIAQLQESGTTVIIVTHSVDLVREFCDKALWIQKGEQKLIDESHKVADAYEGFMLS